MGGIILTFSLGQLSIFSGLYYYYYIWIPDDGITQTTQITQTIDPKRAIRLSTVFRSSLNYLGEYDWFYLIVDSLNLPLIILNCILASCAIYYTIFTMNSFETLRKIFINLLFAMFLLNILFTTVNLGVFYISFELLVIPLFFLISLGSRLRRLRAVTLFTMYTIMFSYVMLFGLIYVWVWFGTLHYPEILVIFYYLPAGMSKTALYIFWVSLLLTFLAKIPVVPFHIWLPEAHAEATAVGSVILAGIVLKVGSYGIIRFLVPLQNLLPDDILFACVGLISLTSAAYATIMTLAQVDFKRIIAYSSVAHLSLSIAGIFTLTKPGLIGAYYYNIGHGFVSAGLFFLAGLFYHTYGTRLLKYYSGLAVLTSICRVFLVFSFANIGFPLTVNFVSEFLIITSLVSIGNLCTLILIFIIFFGSLVFSLWTYLRMTTGSLSYHILKEHEDLTLPFLGSHDDGSPLVDACRMPYYLLKPFGW